MPEQQIAVTDGAADQAAQALRNGAQMVVGFIGPLGAEGGDADDWVKLAKDAGMSPVLVSGRPRRGPPRDQPISLPARLTGPQWMNMPKDRKSTRLNSSHLVISYA